MEMSETIRTTNRPQEIKVEISFGDRLLIFERAATILGQHDNSRDADETKQLMDCLDLLEMVQEYKNSLPEPIYKDLIKKCSEYLKYEAYEPGEIIFHYKEPVDRIIFVARGCVDLYEPKGNDELVNEISEIQDLLFKSKTNSANELIRELEEVKISITDKKYFTSPKFQRSIPQRASRVMSMFYNLCHYNVVKNLTHDKEAHQYFDRDINSTLKYLDAGISKFKKASSQTLGYSLLNPQEIKGETHYPYTAVASASSQIISIHRDKYLKVFDTLKSKLEEKWKFFGDYLENRTAKIVKPFYRAFKERVYRRNQRIFQQGDLCNEVYALQQGEVELFKPAEQEKGNMSNMLSELRRASNVNDFMVTAGRMFGEIDASHAETHQCTAIAKEDDTIVYVATLKDYHYLKQQFKMILRKVRDKFENAGDAVSRSNSDSRSEMSDLSIISTHRFDEDFDRPGSKGSVTREGLARNISPLYKGSSFRPKADKPDSKGDSKGGDSIKGDSLNASVNIIEDAQIDDFNQLLHGASKPSNEMMQNLSKFALQSQEKIDTALTLYPTQDILDAANGSIPQILEPEEEVSPDEPYQFVRHNSFQRLIKQKVDFFEKKLKFKNSTPVKIATPVYQRPFEIDLMKITKRANKTAQAPRLGRINPSASAKAIIIDTSPQKKSVTPIQDFKKLLNELPSNTTTRSNNDFSVAGSQYRKTGLKIDTKAVEDLEVDEGMENYVTPSHHSLVSLSKKHLTTDQPSQTKDFAPLQGIRSPESIQPQILQQKSPQYTKTQNRFFVQDFKPNMASLELAAPFSKKKVPLMLSMNSVKTMDTVKTMKTIFKKPGFISPEHLTLKEITVNPDTIRGSEDQTPIMRKTFTSTNHNMFRIKPTRLHIAMKKYKNLGF